MKSDEPSPAEKRRRRQRLAAEMNRLTDARQHRSAPSLRFSGIKGKSGAT